MRVAGGLGGRVALSFGVGAFIAAGVLVGPLAAPARAAFSAPIGLSGVAANGPKAVNDADGNAIAVWSKYNGAKYPVQVRQITVAGEPGPVKTLSAAAQSPVYPQIAGDGDGGAIVVWSQFNGVSTPLKARRISANGRPGKLKTVSRGPNTAKPRIVSDGKGKAIVVWAQKRPGKSRIKARKISAAGRLGPVKTLSRAGKKSGSPEIATDAHGDAVAVWSQEGDKNSRIKARRIPKHGALGHVKTLSRSKEYAALPVIASDRRGDATAVWTQSTNWNHGHIKARRIGAKGALGHVKTLAAENGTPDIATDRRGDATVAWDTYGGGTGIQARQISPDGAVGPLRTLLATHGVAHEPQVGTDAAGNATVVWSVYRPQGPSPVQARQISAAGALGPTQTITSDEGRDPEIAVNGEGDAFAVWQQFDGSSWRVWGAFGP